MRCVLCSLMTVCLLSGCHNQTMPVSNPFMSPNRVPPPATRTLPPGTAQPYYPGDPVPNSPAGAVPPSTYTPQPAAPATQSSPPGGWNTYPQTGPVSSAPSGNLQNGIQQASANIPLGPAQGDGMQVPTDEQNLRFNRPPQSVSSPVAPASFDTAQPAIGSPQQFAGIQNSVNPNQFAQPAPLAEQRQVSIRAIPSSELPQAGIDSSTLRIGRDGFRPQGSGRTARDQAQAVTRPIEPQVTSPVQESVAQFGFDPQYQWLRGQLQQSPATGQWHLRYIPQGGSPDQFGGNILVANPQVLGNLSPGEHVSVQGRLEMVQFDAQSALPAYTIAVLQRQQSGLR